MSFRGDSERARLALEESLAVARSLGYNWGIAQVLRQLGGVVAYQGDPCRGADLIEEALVLWRQLQSRRGLYWTLLDLGRVALMLDDPRRAATCLAESVTICRDLGDRRGLAKSLEALAAAGAACGSECGGLWSSGATRLLGAAMAIRDAGSTPLAPVDRPVVDRAVAAARATLDDDAYETALAEGRAMPLAGAIELALELAERIHAGAPTGDSAIAQTVTSAGVEALGRGVALTAREREVAILVGRGYANRRIAEQLVIAEKTAEVHARNIREKLGLASRTQIAAWAAQHGLLDA